MNRRAPNPSTTVRRSTIDPSGRRALFESPVAAAPDTLRAGRQTNVGRAALFSTGPREAGTVVVECSACQTRTRISLADLAGRLLNFSAYLPLLRRDHPHRMPCPDCGDRTWCRIGWND